MQLPESSLRLQNRVVWPLVTLFQTNRAPVTIGYLQRGVFTAGGERASLLIRASIRCYPPATEQYADFADRRIYPRMLRIAADLPADYADFTNGFWGVQIDGFFRGLAAERLRFLPEVPGVAGGGGIGLPAAAAALVLATSAKGLCPSIVDSMALAGFARLPGNL